MSARRVRRPFLLALACLLAAFALAACGDDAETSTSAGATAADTTTSSSEATGSDDSGLDPGASIPRPEPVIEDFLVSPDSAAVCGSLSPELLASTYGDLSGCRSGRPPQSLASSMKPDKIVVTGEKATAVVVPDGGAYDGADVTFALSYDGERWTIDKVKADIPVGP